MEAEGRPSLDGEKIQVDTVKEAVSFIPAMFPDGRPQFCGVLFVVLRDLPEVEPMTEVACRLELLEHQSV